MTLGDFLEEEKKSVSTMLAAFVESSRLEKAHEIKDIEIIEMGSDKIVADVKGYSVYIDFEKRFKGSILLVVQRIVIYASRTK